ncbi:putative cullin [Schistosoma mansoni]|uniref:putative cullin n=1 Tax=Schistosoma mansoni TaxID=6183 RepID=UPI0001A644C5|nr:putative cullin [Schistosoma mansoni]|eukprot:XP_018653890.1 putative cullin [Schistosoma mansoni]
MSTGSSARRTEVTNAKVRIKAFPPSIDERYANQLWDQIKSAIIEIQKKNNSCLSFEELYRNAYTLILQKHGERLYAGTEAVVREHMIKIRDSIVENLNNKFLTYLNSCWKDHQTAMGMIRDILMYMDRVYVGPHNLDGVYKMGMTVFCDLVVRYPIIREHLQKTLLDMVRRERRGEVISRSQIRDACQMFVQLGAGSLRVYLEDFEQPFLEQSREFYRTESENFLAENTSASLYIKKVEQRIEEEVRRAHHHLDPSTEPKIVVVLEEELISRHMETIVGMEDSGLTYMLTHDHFSDIAAMYGVLSRVEEGPKIMSNYISLYLREQGRNTVRDTGSSTPQQHIQDLLQLRDRANELLTRALNNQTIFRNQINSDFEYFVNLNPRSPEFLSLFIDEKLKRGTKGMADQDVDAIFDKCIVLFRYLQEKDLFEGYYKKHLAKRLLLSKSQSDDQEKIMISKLMAECGAVYTSKLEGMFKDMAVSKTLMDEFNAVLSNGNRNLNLDLCVRVLTTGLWPTQATNSNEALPEEADTAFKVYKNFYLSKHNGRKINLQTNMGYAELSAVFYGRSPGAPKTLDPPNLISTSSRPNVRKYFLQVSTYQMIILMKFNRRNRYSFIELASETNIPERELKRSLMALALGRCSQRILCKEPKTRDIESTDVFYVNDSFVSKHIKVRVQSITVKESEPERQETRTKVDENRRYVIEATIVRVMKARKTLSHGQLVVEVIEQLKSRFVPTPVMIKQRIESLIEREFLARLEDDRRVYKYLA